METEYTPIQLLRDTRIVNFCGGPGIGKSTTAAELFAVLKRRSIMCELVLEKAKEYAWHHGGNPGKYTIQPKLHATQLYRQAVAIGKVDFIITDSPTILCAMYWDTLGYGTAEFKAYALAEFNRHNNVNINLVRRKEYVPEGRHLDEEGARGIDNVVTTYMTDNGISFIDFDTVDNSTEDLADMLVGL